MAVRLTGWKIDIKSVSEAAREGIIYGQDAEFEKTFVEEMTKDEPVIEDVMIEESFEELEDISKNQSLKISLLKNQSFNQLLKKSRQMWK